jgi:hypothetical protein
MQQEVQALLRALLVEQQRERDLYHSLLAAMSVTAAARKRMLEDIISASQAALGVDRDENRGPVSLAQDHLTEAIKQMAEARNGMFKNNSLN